jgi:hypothetical protein
MAKSTLSNQQLDSRFKHGLDTFKSESEFLNKLIYLLDQVDLESSFAALNESTISNNNGGRIIL